MTIPEYAFQTTYTLCRSNSHTNSTTSLGFFAHYCSKHVCSGLVYSAYNTTTTLHQFNGLFSETACVSQYQKGKTSLDLNEARDDGVLGWQWHQLDHM